MEVMIVVMILAVEMGVTMLVIAMSDNAGDWNGCDVGDRNGCMTTIEMDEMMQVL